MIQDDRLLRSNVGLKKAINGALIQSSIRSVPFSSFDPFHSWSGIRNQTRNLNPLLIDYHLFSFVSIFISTKITLSRNIKMSSDLVSEHFLFLVSDQLAYHCFSRFVTRFVLLDYYISCFINDLSHVVSHVTYKIIHSRLIWDE